MTLSRETTISLLNTGPTALYDGGTQHARCSPFPPTRQTQPFSRNLNNISGEKGTRSSAAHGGRCWGGMGKRPWSVAMNLWPSKKEQNVVRCLVSYSMSRRTSFVDLTDATSQTRTVPPSPLV